MIHATTTTYNPKECGEVLPAEPCIIVFDDDDMTTYVRFAPCYHYSSDTTVVATEFVDGEWNSAEELNVKWDDLSPNMAKELAKKCSAYIK